MKHNQGLKHNRGLCGNAGKSKERGGTFPELAAVRAIVTGRQKAFGE